MPRLRRKIYLDDICYIDFDINVLRCYNSKGIFKNRNIAPDDRIALKIFCENYKDYVHSYNIFKEIKGKPFEEGIDDPQWISSKISKLREKMRNQKGEDFIKNFGKNNFQLPLKESPFEDDEKEIEQLLAMNEELKFENEKLSDEIKGLQATLADLKNKEDYQLDKDTKKATINWFPNSTLDFFYKLVLADNKELEKVSSIDLALSHPYCWIEENANILERAIFDRKVNFRVLFNIPFSKDIAELTKLSVDGYLETESGWVRNYLDNWSRAIRAWCFLRKICPEQIEIRRAITPILHDIYIGKGEKINCVRARYITYGNGIETRDPVLFFRDSDDAYSLYQHEFEYMWKSATKNSGIDNGIDNGIFEYLTDDEKIELQEILKEFDDKSTLQDLVIKVEEDV